WRRRRPPGQVAIARSSQPPPDLARRNAKRRPEGRRQELPKQLNLERAKRFELSTPTLARLCSTTELRPRSSKSPPESAASTVRRRLMAEGRGLGKRLRDAFSHGISGSSACAC